MLRNSVVASVLLLFITSTAHSENVTIPKMDKQQVYNMLKTEVSNDPSIIPLAKCVSKTPEETRNILVAVLDKCWTLAPETFDQLTDENDMIAFANCYEEASINSFNISVSEIEACIGEE